MDLSKNRVFEVGLKLGVISVLIVQIVAVSIEWERETFSMSYVNVAYVGFTILALVVATVGWDLLMMIYFVLAAVLVTVLGIRQLSYFDSQPDSLEKDWQKGIHITSTFLCAVITLVVGCGIACCRPWKPKSNTTLTIVGV